MKLAAAMAMVALLATGGPRVASAQPSAAPAPGRTPDLSGTFAFDAAASAVDPAVRYAGLGGNAGTPTMLYLTHARNGTVIVGSNTNTSHARTYVPGGESKAPLGDGLITMRSRWVGVSLVSEGRDAATGKALGERLTPSADGQSLVIEIRTTGDAAPGAPAPEIEARLVYRRVVAELPCEQWPTPCKDWSQQPATADPPGAPP